MFLGHFGLALAARRLTAGRSLGAAVLAAQWADLLWPVLVLAGVERLAVEPGATAFNALDFVSYPWSHSLLALLVWGAVAGGLYYRWTGRPRDAAVVGALVPSHWLLDLVVHRSDLPVWPGGPEVGLGLWTSVAGTLVAEFGLFAAGAAVYLTATSPRNRSGSWGAYGLLLLLVGVYLVTAFGPPPADSTAVAFGALALWLVVPLAGWVDSHREEDREDGAERARSRGE